MLYQTPDFLYPMEKVSLAVQTDKLGKNMLQINVHVYMFMAYLLR